MLVHAEVDGERLEEHEIVMGFFLLMAAGNDSTKATYTSGMRALMEHPEERAKLLADPSLVSSAVEESLRMFPAFAHFRRTAMRDVELNGTTIREGDKVVMWYVSSNRDESRYEDPDRFDAERNPEHQAFGAGGRHYCLGTALARLELNILFEETLKRFPDMELAGTPEYVESPFVNQLKTLPVTLAMKRIGLLGGMSWESSIEYYRLVNELVAERLGGLHSADCVLRSVDFAAVEELQRTGRWEEAGELLAAEARSLEAAGAELLVLCTNTMHKLAAEVAGAVSIPFVHIADTTAEAVRVGRAPARRAAGHRLHDGAGLLRRAPARPARARRPRSRRGGPARRARVIYEELCRGRVEDASRAEYRRIIGALVEGGAEAILLGCTEIDLLVGEEDSPVPMFDTTRIHAERAVELALA